MEEEMEMKGTKTELCCGGKKCAILEKTTKGWKAYDPEREERGSFEFSDDEFREMIKKFSA